MAGSFKFDNTGAMKKRNDRTKRDAFVRMLAFDVQGGARKSMIESPATGKTHQRGNKVHVSASRGNPPRVDMGTLINSIDVRKIADMVHEVGTPVLHGKTTEFMGFPWLRPQFMRIKKDINKLKKGHDIV